MRKIFGKLFKKIKFDYCLTIWQLCYNKFDPINLLKIQFKFKKKNLFDLEITKKTKHIMEP